MNFGLNENQVILRDSAREFFAGECTPATVRRVMETATGHDAALWAQLAAQGYTGIIFDEELGGVGLGVVELALLMEEAGRALLPGPLFSTVALAGAVIDECASDEQKRQLLPPICRGEVCATVALLESGTELGPGGGADDSNEWATLRRETVRARCCGREDHPRRVARRRLRGRDEQYWRQH
jgi:alkylation response protein AidB-like acyl-CoA dehydrogenase